MTEKNNERDPFLSERQKLEQEWATLRQLQEQARAALAHAGGQEPVAWYIADDHGQPFKSVCYQLDRDKLEAKGHKLLPLYATPPADHSEADIQMVSSASAQQAEPIYQVQMADGSWIDQAEHNYRFNLQFVSNKVRIVYAAPAPSASPAALTDALIEHEAGVFGHYNGEMGQWVFDEYRLLEFARSVIGLAASPADHSGDSADMVASAPEGFTIKRVKGHGWIIDPPAGSRWIAHEGTPAGDFIAALLASKEGA
jgi:hypothetical protein